MTHEPLLVRYRPQEFLRCYEDPSAILAIPHVRAHLDRVEAILERRHYIETGWPVYSAVPYFISRFPGRTRVVHVVRHPVASSISRVSHSHFDAANRDDDWATLGLVHPGSRGLVQPGFESRWGEMTPFEKSLFHWTEVNAYADELHERYPAVPFMRIRFEDMFDAGSTALEDLVEFLGLPPRAGLLQAQSHTVDKWHFRVDGAVDWRAINQYPAALDLMSEYGYDLQSIDEAALTAKYSAAGRQAQGGAAAKGEAPGAGRRLQRAVAGSPRARALYGPVRVASRVEAGWRLLLEAWTRRPSSRTYRLNGSARSVALRLPGDDLVQFDRVFRWRRFAPPARALELLGGDPLVVDLGAGSGLVSLYLLDAVPSARVRSISLGGPEEVALLTALVGANGAGDRWTVEINPGAELAPAMAGADLLRVNVRATGWDAVLDRAFLDIDAPVVVLDYADDGTLYDQAHHVVFEVLSAAGFSVQSTLQERGAGVMWGWKGLSM